MVPAFAYGIHKGAFQACRAACTPPRKAWSEPPTCRSLIRYTIDGTKPTAHERLTYSGDGITPG